MDFSGAYMRHANLAYSDLSGVILIGADLFEADLTGVNLDGVCWDDSTWWPTDFGGGPCSTLMLNQREAISDSAPRPSDAKAVSDVAISPRAVSPLLLTHLHPTKPPPVAARRASRRATGQPKLGAGWA